MLQVIEEWNTKDGPFSQFRLVAIDVVDLYTNIPHGDMETAIKYFLSARGSQLNAPPADRIIEIVRHVLSNNFFQFDGHVYHQKMGTAMGTPMAPTVANLFMGWLEEQLIDASPVPINSCFWKRFIDDIFLLWDKSEAELDQLEQFMNSIHPTIKFTVLSSAEEISFLDINLKLEEGFIQTSMYSKPTDAHAVLHATSCHPRHCKENIPYSQFIRVRRLCSKQADFETQVREMSTYFRQRGYSKQVIQRAVNRARNVRRTECLNYGKKQLATERPLSSHTTLGIPRWHPGFGQIIICFSPA